MSAWIKKNIFKPPVDENVARIKELFSYLLNDYKFEFAKNDLGDAVDVKGKRFFYGPLYSYHIYNDNVCINILFLVQREDYSIFITDSYKKDQVYIRKGTMIPWRLAYDLPAFADEIKLSVEKYREIYGRKINNE